MKTALAERWLRCNTHKGVDLEDGPMRVVFVGLGLADGNPKCAFGGVGRRPVAPILIRLRRQVSVHGVRGHEDMPSLLDA